MSHLDPIISDLALILMLAGVTTIIFKWLKQPVVLGYIVAGFLASGHSFLTGVTDSSTVNIWAEIGIIFLLFSLGLEFSFKKLVHVGGPAVITALIIIAGMMFTGFMAGRMLHWSSTDSIFLGGMLSMSSTTIIFKAFNDLGLKNRKFTTLVFGILVVEDLFAVLLMVILSSLYLHKNIEEIQVATSIFKLMFFLITWFAVGIYLIPTALTKLKRFLNQETILILSIGLCLAMVVLANFVGLSSALGAFIMGSILAETNEHETIDRVVSPVKDLFGAIFFVSVGMLVNPALIAQYIFPIIFLSLVVIVGQILYSSIGLLISGQNLKIAMQSSFSLAQIGEFAFIIATLGVTLGVTSHFLYPIVVAVSVLTTFTTPFIMKLSEPMYNRLDKVLPSKIQLLLAQYSAGSQDSTPRSQWRELLRKSLTSIGIYSIVLGGMVWLATQYYMPFIEGYFHGFWGKMISTTTTILFMTPLLWALAIRHLDRKLFITLWKDPNFNHGLLVSIIILRIFIAGMFLMTILVHLYSYRWGTIIGFGLLIMSMLLFWKRIKKGFLHFEYQFYKNLEDNDSSRITKIDKQAKFLHMAHLVVSPDCEYIGKCLSQLNLRARHGITIISIQRGTNRIIMPRSTEVLMPADTISVVGSDTHIKEFASQVEFVAQSHELAEVTMKQFSIGPHSVLINMTLSQFGMMCAGECMVIGIERKDGTFIEPMGLIRFMPYDLVWIAGDKQRMSEIMRTMSTSTNS